MLPAAPDSEDGAGIPGGRTSLRLPHRPWWRLACAAVVTSTALLLAGCANPAHRPTGPHPVPTSAAECNDLPAVHGDPGVLMGTDWTDEPHDWGDTVIVDVCVVPDSEERIWLTAESREVQIGPRTVHPDATSTGVIPFRVTVLRGGTGTISMHQDGAGVSGDMPGPVVAADGDGWHFAPHRD